MDDCQDECLACKRAPIVSLVGCRYINLPDVLSGNETEHPKFQSELAYVEVTIQ